MLRKTYRLFRINKDERWIAFLAFILFAFLAVVMVLYTAGWGNPDMQRHGFTVSGFDNAINGTLRNWKISFSLLRHPLLPLLLWPLAQLDTAVRSLTGLEYSTHIIGVLWTALNTYSFLFLYRTMHICMDLRKVESAVLTFFFFSLAFVLLTAMTPDHMTMTLFILSLALYVSTDRIKKGRVLKTRYSLIYFFFCAGITATNGIKIILADAVTIVSQQVKKWRKRQDVSNPLTAWGIAKHFLYYLLPVALLVGAYHAQVEYIYNPQAAKSLKNKRAKMAKNSAYAKEIKKRDNSYLRRKKKQVYEGKIFEFTDKTVDRMRTVKDNIFGEGLQLHEQYLLQDPQGRTTRRRPLFLDYTNPFHYFMEILLVALLVVGVVCGVRRGALWVPLTWFLFDMTIHVAFAFAIVDVYIMTAHWALVFPVAYACILKSIGERRKLRNAMTCLFALITIYLLAYNGSLIIPYFLCA